MINSLNMLFPLPLLVLSLGVSARILPPRDTPCTFLLTAVGEPNGTVRETTIGQNRIGGTYPQGSYYFNGTSLFDSLNHNCLIDATSLQFQCVQGALGTTNFSIGGNYNLLHDGSGSWLACPASGPGDDGSFNIFSDSAPVSSGCEIVTLRTGGFCTAMGRPSSPSSSAAPSTTLSTITAPAQASTSISGLPVITPFTIANSTQASTTSPAAVCPTNISGGTFQYPHLIVPTSPQAPDYAFGNSYKAYISPINTTLFNFDIPAADPYTGTCSLLFLFPYGTDLDPSASKYYFSGVEEELGEHGGLDFALLDGIATNFTTFNTTPEIATDYGKTEIMPGNNYTIATFPCQSGETISYQASSIANVELDYFQDSLPSPIGLYIVPCA